MAPYTGPVRVEIPDGISGFQQTIGTEVVALTSAIATGGGFTLKAHKDNEGIIYFGVDDEVDETTAVYELEARDTVFISVNDTASVWTFASQAGQKLYAIGG